jgi:hypothetical protein
LPSGQDHGNLAVMRPLGTTVMASQIRAVVEGAARAGLDRETLLTAAGINADKLADPDARVPFTIEVRLWEEIERQFPGEPVGLALAPFAFDAEAFGAVGFAARTSADLGAAFDVAVRYCRVTNEGTETRLVRESNGARLIDGPSNRRERWPRAKAEFVLAGYVVLGRRWTGSSWLPREVRFQHAAPANLAPYQTLFQAQVAFCQPRNELLLDASLLDQPLLQADPQLSAFLRRQGDLLVMQLVEEGRLALTTKLEVLGGILPLDRLHVMGEVSSGRTITVEQLLRHRSGLADYFFDGPIGEDGLTPYMRELVTEPPQVRSASQLIDWTIAHLPPVALPGAAYHYADTNYVLLEGV